jgi:acetyl/propionyl-CoA carboxylase alpha subunit
MELITGLDLVEEQIRIARGEKLRFSQEDLVIDGHAIEIRVCAEDPVNNFLPDVGTLHRYCEPIGKGIRVDSGFEEGMEIPIYYDPMIAKLIVHAPTRFEAMQKMIEAINSYEIVGIETTLDFCRFVMEHEAFRSGNFDTGFIGKYFDKDKLNTTLSNEERDVVAVTTQLLWKNYGQNLPDSLPPVVKNENEQMSDWRKVRTL